MFQLIWRQSALDRLADLYVAATPDERERMAAGVERMNEQLRADPTEVGESRPAGRRIAFPPLLLVTIRVFPADRVVRVTSVRRYGR